MVALCIPFMKIRSLRYGAQHALKGSVINVPINLNTAVLALPRNFVDLFTVQLHLLRRSGDVHPYQYDMIRPGYVLAAAEYLIEHGSLYKDSGIQLNKDWIRQPASEAEPFIASLEDQLMVDSEIANDQQQQQQQQNRLIEEENENKFSAACVCIGTVVCFFIGYFICMYFLGI